MKNNTIKPLNKNYKDAPIFKRILAYVIDLCIYTPFAFLFIFSSRVYAYEGDLKKSLFMLLCLLIVSIFLFSYIPKKWNGQTIGKKILKIKLQSTVNSKEISYWSYFLREYFAKIGIGILIVPMSFLYSIFMSISNRKITKTFMLDQLFSVKVIDLE